MFNLPSFDLSSVPTTAPGEGPKFAAFPAAGMLTAHVLLHHLTVTSTAVTAGPAVVLQTVTAVH